MQYAFLAADEWLYFSVRVKLYGVPFPVPVGESLTQIRKSDALLVTVTVLDRKSVV